MNANKKKNFNLKKFFGKQTVTFKVSISFITLLILAGIIFCAIYFPTRATIDTSIVQKLGHYQAAGSTRSNDMYHPAKVTDVTCRLIIELDYPKLCYTVDPIPAIDHGDVWIVFGMCPSPITTITDWADEGIYIDELYFSGAEYRSMCYDSDGIYDTHFYYVWEGLPQLMEGYVYALYVDFIDADGTMHTCPAMEDMWDGYDMLGRDRPKDILATFEEPSLDIQVAEVDLTNCAHISFFELNLGTGTTPPTTSGGTGPGETIPPGNFGDGVWNNQDPFFANLQEQFIYNPGMSWGILVAIILLIALLILVIILLVKKKKNK